MRLARRGEPWALLGQNAWGLRWLAFLASVLGQGVRDGEIQNSCFRLSAKISGAQERAWSDHDLPYRSYPAKSTMQRASPFLQEGPSQDTCHLSAPAYAVDKI